jgi:hypothetical protein
MIKRLRRVVRKGRSYGARQDLVKEKYENGPLDAARSELKMSKQ